MSDDEDLLRQGARAPRRKVDWTLTRAFRMRG